MYVCECVCVRVCECTQTHFWRRKEEERRSFGGEERRRGGGKKMGRGRGEEVHVFIYYVDWFQGNYGGS